MKKFIYSIFLLGGMIVSCKRDKTTNPADSTYALKFSITGFTQIIEPITNGGELESKNISAKASPQLTLKEMLPNGLTYQVFDTDQKLIHQIHQKATLADFGVITDSLPTGNYIIVFVGNGDADETTFTGHYFKRLDVNISQQNNNMEKTVILDMVGGILELNIEDLNADVGREPSTFASISGDYDFFQTFDLPKGGGNNGASIHNTIEQNPSSTYIRNVMTPMTVELSGYFFNDSEIEYPKFNLRTIYNVRCFQNTKTILTGKLYTGNNDSNGFEVRFEEYDVDTIRVNF